MPRTALFAQHTHARPRSILGNYLICTLVSKMEINHMFFLLFLCFLPIFHIICVYTYVVIYYGTLCEHGICVLKDSTGK
jgi:hypothetical protein